MGLLVRVNFLQQHCGFFVTNGWSWEPQPLTKKPRSAKAAKAEADRWFSLARREAADWSCQFVHEGTHCNLAFIPPTKELQCSHIQGRGNNATRFRVENALSLCASHHAWVEIRPLNHAILAEHYIGKDGYEELVRLSNMTVHYRKDDFIQIAKHFHDEFYRVRESRAAGHCGYIELTNWE